MKKYKKNNYNSGFSVLEIMVSLAAGVLLLACLLKIYSFQETIHHDIQEQIRLDNRALTALYILNNEIQTAGYIGCLKYQAELGFMLEPVNIVSAHVLQIEKMDPGLLPIHIGDRVIVSDCHTAQKVIYSKNNYTKKQIGRYIQESFYVQHKALFLKRTGDNAVEIISGIENIEFKQNNNKIWVKLGLVTQNNKIIYYTRIILLQEL